ncbi:macrophage mannose receptor 1-like [Megalobrama amblycephala]|uniref:macrophage mannose receptor 1-like n=1 Tax=Megalobrama amblycephala TaxID=75352 RepID=UPI0020141E95|nr:macrophage mannose receptor 1-like [Megalobrama amblycephala]
MLYQGPDQMSEIEDETTIQDVHVLAFHRESGELLESGEQRKGKQIKLLQSGELISAEFQLLAVEGGFKSRSLREEMISASLKENESICHGRKYQYQFINESRTWQDAQSYCRVRFTDLATADNMSDAGLLVNTVDVGYSGSVWIGLHNGTEYRWVWSIGTLSQYSIWNSGEPNGDGGCVRSFNGSWYDESCITALPFVCFNDSSGFIIITTAMAWRDAQSYCRQHHTDLASISSAEQQNLIRNQASLWIGLFLDSWQWSDSGNLSFRYWTEGQPSQSSGSECVGMSRNNSGKWAHESCDLKRPFICHGGEFP